jgi:hypothetical protein
MKNVSFDKLLAEAERRGLVLTTAAGDVIGPGDPTPGRERLAEASFTPPGAWVVPLRTASESNQRDWRAKSARTQAARRAVSKALGPHLRHLAAFADHFHSGGALGVTLTRIAPKRLDRGNAFAAMKAVEDAVALMLGADDGDPRWRLDACQEVGPGYGVEVSLACL